MEYSLLTAVKISSESCNKNKKITIMQLSNAEVQKFVSINNLLYAQSSRYDTH